MSQLNVNTVRGQDGLGTPDTNQLGQGQTYQNVTAQRALGTTYTNTTGRPIWVSVQCSQANATVITQLTVGGVVVSYNGANGAGANNLSVQGIVPAGATYSVTNGSLLQWVELR